MDRDIVYDYGKMKDAATNIRNIATDYGKLGEEFLKAIEGHMSSWEGDSKDKFLTLLEGEVRRYIVEEIQKMLNSFAQLLETDADEMKKADEQVAAGIPEGIGLGT